MKPERKIIEITTSFIRLDAFLKFTGEAQTGGHAKAMILEGVVKVDGDPCGQRGKKLFTGSVVTVEDRAEYEVLSRAD